MSLLEALQKKKAGLAKTETKEAKVEDRLAHDPAYVKIASDIQEIIAHLYLSGSQGASNQEKMESCKISHVLIAAANLKPAFPDKYTYLNIHLIDHDDKDITGHFDEVFEWMDAAIQKSQNVLVHCAAGVSRSAAFVIAYIMKSQKKPYDEAFALVFEKRSIIQPNSGFVKQLREFEASGYQLKKANGFDSSAATESAPPAASAS